MNDSLSVLLAEDEPNLRRALASLLKRAGHEVTACADGTEAYHAALEDPHDIVLTDLAMPGLDGLDLLAKLRELDPHLPVILLTAHGAVENAVEAMKRGAFDFLTKPVGEADLLAVVHKAGRAARASRRDIAAPAGASAADSVISRSAAMAEVLATVRRVAPSDATVLLLGETGTGKELIARALHESGPRASHPFIAVNCGALPEHLAESELFGHEEGAFTGASARRIGRFELADGGTLFLDEIGDLPPALQVKLLRALQERIIERVGGFASLPLDIRLVAATNRDLHTRVAEGAFREDLYYRLNVVPITLPPLRDRPEDVAPLARHFLDRLRAKHHAGPAAFSDEALNALTRYPWPGNVRELQNIVERLVLLTDGDTIALDNLPRELRQEDGSISDTGDFRSAVESSGARVERALIVEALEKTGGNRTHASQLLGISRKTLQNKIKAYQID